MFVFAKVIPKTLLVPFFSGHGAVAAARIRLLRFQAVYERLLFFLCLFVSISKRIVLLCYRLVCTIKRLARKMAFGVIVSSGT